MISKRKIETLFLGIQAYVRVSCGRLWQIVASHRMRRKAIILIKTLSLSLIAPGPYLTSNTHERQAMSRVKSAKAAANHSKPTRKYWLMYKKKRKFYHAELQSPTDKLAYHAACESVKRTIHGPHFLA